MHHQLLQTTTHLEVLTVLFNKCICIQLYILFVAPRSVCLFASLLQIEVPNTQDILVILSLPSKEFL